MVRRAARPRPGSPGSNEPGLRGLPGGAYAERGERRSVFGRSRITRPQPAVSSRRAAASLQLVGVGHDQGPRRAGRGSRTVDLVGRGHLDTLGGEQRRRGRPPRRGVLDRGSSACRRPAVPTTTRTADDHQARDQEHPDHPAGTPTRSRRPRTHREATGSSAREVGLAGRRRHLLVDRDHLLVGRRVGRPVPVDHGVEALRAGRAAPPGRSAAPGRPGMPPPRRCGPGVRRGWPGSRARGPGPGTGPGPRPPSRPGPRAPRPGLGSRRPAGSSPGPRPHRGGGAASAAAPPARRPARSRPGRCPPRAGTPS